MISWINIAKGIAILAIVYGHSYPPDWIYDFFFYFHIPIFYFISGYLFNKSQPPFKDFIKHKFKTLMIPFYIYGFIMTLLMYVLLWKNGILDKENTIHYFMGLIDGRPNHLANNNLWFLSSLFFTNLIGYITLKKIPYSKLLFITIIALDIYFIYLTNRMHNSIYSISTIPPALFFFIMGYYYKDYEFSLENSKLLFGFFVFVMAVYAYSDFVVHQEIHIGGNYYGRSILLMLFNGLIGTLLVIFLSKKINQNNLLEYLGTTSLYIFIFHQAFVPITEAFNSALGIEKHFLIIGTVKLAGSIMLYEWVVKPLKRQLKYL